MSDLLWEGQRTHWCDMKPVWKQKWEEGLRRYGEKAPATMEHMSGINPNVFSFLSDYPFHHDTGIVANDKLLKGRGDGGWDFMYRGKTYDIKGCSYYKQEPYMREKRFPKYWADYYVLCLVDVNGQRARTVCWTYKEVLQNAPTANWGWGDMYYVSIYMRGVFLGYPPWLPMAKR